MVIEVFIRHQSQTFLSNRSNRHGVENKAEAYDRAYQSNEVAD
jgi:hypothetical protein